MVRFDEKNTKDNSLVNKSDVEQMINRFSSFTSLHCKAFEPSLFLPLNSVDVGRKLFSVSLRTNDSDAYQVNT